MVLVVFGLGCFHHRIQMASAFCWLQSFDRVLQNQRLKSQLVRCVPLSPLSLFGLVLGRPLVLLHLGVQRLDSLATLVGVRVFQPQVLLVE
jgi:hypothetical protein